jgi:hypothetical protein
MQLQSAVAFTRAVQQRAFLPGQRTRTPLFQGLHALTSKRATWHGDESERNQVAAGNYRRPRPYWPLLDLCDRQARGRRAEEEGPAARCARRGFRVSGGDA